MLYLTHRYSAYPVVDDAHGTGVIGKPGRGVIEKYDLFGEVDIITGTFSKALQVWEDLLSPTKNLLISLIPARQHLFSTTATPAILGIIKAIDLLDEEPFWMEMLWKNINYIKTGLLDIGFDIGTTESAIIPVKIGDISKTLEPGKLLLKSGVFANPIMYPAVSKKNARISLNIMATHTAEQLDHVLNAFSEVIISYLLSFETIRHVIFRYTKDNGIGFDESLSGVNSVALLIYQINNKLGYKKTGSERRFALYPVLYTLPLFSRTSLKKA